MEWLVRRSLLLVRIGRSLFRSRRLAAGRVGGSRSPSGVDEIRYTTNGIQVHASEFRETAEKSQQIQTQFSLKQSDREAALTGGRWTF